ncbi:uncharacterized protein LOC144455341 [Phascolarctos cinereus]
MPPPAELPGDGVREERLSTRGLKGLRNPSRPAWGGALRTGPGAGTTLPADSGPPPRSRASASHRHARAGGPAVRVPRLVSASPLPLLRRERAGKRPHLPEAAGASRGGGRGQSELPGRLRGARHSLLSTVLRARVKSPF